MSTDRIDRSTWRHRIGWTGVALGLLSWVAGCGSDSDSFGPPGTTPSSFVVSDPVTSAAPASASGAGASVAGSREVATLVYVSLAEGELPGGTSATIQNWRTGNSVVTPMLAGGFDPVAIEAEAGDTLEIEVAVNFQPAPLRFLVQVPLAAPPIVVRTEPADGKRDVPLNARIVIVFSEPIDGTTLTGSTIRLKREDVDVAGVLQFADADQLRAEFLPDEPLEPDTEYELVVSQGIEDLDGEPLQAPVGVAFTTSSASATRLVFTVQPGDAFEGSPFSPAVEVTVQDALGNVVTTFGDNILLGLSENPGGAQLIGVRDVVAVDGKATFPSLAVDGSGVGLRLVASADGFASDTSVAFEVTATASAVVGVYERKTPHRYPAFRSRYTIHEDGGFELRYEIVSDTLISTGTYTRYGSWILFDFDGDTQARPMEAYGRPLGDSLLAIAYNWVMDSAGFEEGWYTSDPDTAPPPPSPAPPGQLAFVRDGQIYLVNADGSGLILLSDGSSPAWSPDGQRIAFADSRNGSQGIYVMNGDGSNVIQRTSFGGWPSWSPDGQWIVFAGYNGDESTPGFPSLDLYMTRAEGDGESPINLTDREGWEDYPAWSPDGRIAFASDWALFDSAADIYIMDSSGSSPTQVTAGPLEQYQPVWSPVGQRLAVVSCPWAFHKCSSSVIDLMSPDGTDVVPLAVTSGFARPTWSADGQAIAFSSSGEIRWISADGSQQGVIIANGRSPAWRP